jgi:dissimilatory sulfite reductase (desulfoviridin) alpha/beta subunit
MSQLNQEKIDNIFRILRIVHKSHWKPPKIETIETEIKRLGKFIFRIGVEPYVAEVVITPDKTEYVVNQKLPGRLKELAIHYKEQFDTTFSSQNTP